MITQNELDAFFQNKAYAYSQGQLRYLSLLFEVPCMFRIGTKIVTFETCEDIEALFKTYRGNLMARRYAKTTAQVEHVDWDATRGLARCLVTYQNVDDAAATLSTEHVCYFLKRTTENVFRIVETEFLDEASPQLFAGMEQRLTSPA